MHTRLRRLLLASSGAALILGAGSLAPVIASPLSVRVDTEVPTSLVPSPSASPVVAPAPVAPTAPTCGGKLLDSVPVTVAGASVGSLEVYLENGFNCAMVRLRRDLPARYFAKLAPAVSTPSAGTVTPSAPVGPPIPPVPAATPSATPTPSSSTSPADSDDPVRRLPMYAAIQRCEARVEGTLCVDVETFADSGNFLRYAGPVRVYAPKNCIRAEGRIELGDGTEAYAETRPRATFCG